MKPWFKKIHFNGNRSYLISEFIVDEFDGLPHYHPECELLYILTGRGKYIIGDSISDFRAGDLFFLGPNLPHCWKKSAGYSNGQETKFLVVQLNMNILGKYIICCPELEPIARFVERSPLGFYYKGRIRQGVGSKMCDMTHMESFRGMIELLDILRILSLSDQYQMLASPGFTSNFSQQNDERINQVFSFLSKNFNKEIHLEDLANITNMTEWAFCRYFKRITRKTFFTYVNEMRIGYACKLLSETRKNMTEIGYESGYNSISNFNKQFKSLKGINPMKFRNQMMHS